MEVVFRNVHLTFQEYAAANLRYTWRMQKWRLLLPVLLVAGLFAVQLGLPILIAPPDAPPPAAAADSLWPYALGLGFLLVLLPFSMWRALRKRYRNTQFLQSPATYVLSEAGISVSAATVQATSTWDTINKLVPARTVAILVTHSLTAYFLDLRCLQAPTTEADFRALLARHGVAVK